MNHNGFARLIRYWWTLWGVIGLTVLSALVDPFLGYRSVGFIFLLGVLAIGSIAPLGPVLFAAILSTIGWNFFFIPPRFTIAISQPEDLIMCLSFFVVAVCTGALTARSKRHQQLAEEREERTMFLYDVLQDISVAARPEEYISRIEWRIKELLGGKCFILLNDGQGKTANHDLSAKYPNQKVTSLDVKGRNESVGVLAIVTDDENPLARPEAQTLLESVAHQLGLALERSHIEQKLRESERLQESEHLHQTLLNSISHELRTPLTTIMGSATALEDDSSPDTREFRKALATELSQASDRLNRVIGNLLDMSRLSSGALAIHKEWHDLHDLVGVVLNGLQNNLKNHRVTVRLADNLPLLEIDFRLFEHALANVVLNAATYSPRGTEIEISATIEKQNMVIGVMDFGPGIPADSMEKIFEKFYRVPGTPPGGTGLGLSIVKSIIEFHKGQIAASNRPNGGARITIHLPLGLPPKAPVENRHG